MACNQEVFIDDFRIDATEYQLAGDADEVLLRFRADDWTLNGGDVVHTLRGQIAPFVFVQYDEHGEPVREDDVPYLDANGVLALQHPLIELYIEPVSPHELKVRVVENLLPDCTLCLVFSHKELPEVYQEINIHISHAQYELDEMTYTLNSWGVEEHEADVVLLCVIKDSDVPVTSTVYPWKEESKLVQFKDVFLSSGGESYTEMFDPSYLFSHSVEVEIPTRRPDGFGFEMKGDKACLHTELQQFAFSNADEGQKVTVVEAGETLIKKKVHYELSILGCDFRIRNIKTNRERKFSASLYLEAPTEMQIYTQKLN